MPERLLAKAPDSAPPSHAVANRLRSSSAPGRAFIQRKCAGCEGGAPCTECAEDEYAPLSRSAEPGAAAPTAGTGVPPSVRSVLATSGEALAPSLRAGMERHFGHDFSHVRVHTGGEAAESAAAVGAVAFTVGPHVVFGSGRYAPHSEAGARLLAHELTHVVQQRGATVDLDRLAIDGDCSSTAEREADAMAGKLSAGHDEPVARSGAVSSVRLQRARVQRQPTLINDESAGGCGVCHGSFMAGSIAHKLIQEQFALKAMDPNVLGKSPGTARFTEFDLRNLKAVSPGDDTPDPVNARLDLALLDSNGDLRIGEIKPASKKYLKQGREDIKFYSDALRKLGHKPKPLFESIDMRGVVFPNPQIPNCPEFQQLKVNTPTKDEPGVYTYYCTPTREEMMADPKCFCELKRGDRAPGEDVRSAEKGQGADAGEDVGRGRRSVERAQKPDDRPWVPPPIYVEPPPAGPEVKPPVETPGPKTAPQHGEPAEPVQPAEPVEEPPRGDVIPIQRPKPKTAPEPSTQPDEQAVPAAAMTLLALSLAKVKFPKLGKAAGPLAAATAVAALILIANGAEVEAGPGEDILETFFKHANDKGLDIPDDVKDAIKKNPKLRELLSNAHGKGDMSPEMQKAMEELTRLVAENPDAFTDEELEQLVNASETIQKAMPKAKMSIEEIKRALKARKEGRTPTPTAEPGGGGGGEEPSLTPDPVPAPAPAPDAPKPAAEAKIPEDLRKRVAADKAAAALLQEIEGAGVKIDAAFVEEILKVTREAKLTEDDVKKIAASTTTVFRKGMTAEDLLKSLKGIIERRKNAQAPPAGAGLEPGSPSVTAGQPAPGTTQGSNIPPFPNAADVASALDAAQQKAQEARRAEDAKRILQDVKDPPAEGTFRPRTLELEQNIEVTKGTALPPIWVIGQQGGRLYAGVVEPTAVAPVSKTGKVERWTVEIEPSVMYDASGAPLRVPLPKRRFDMDVRRGKIAPRRK